jgi:CRP-like cAMP-binding protein
MKVQDSEILRRSSVFRFLSDEHFAAIEPLLQEEHYEFGDVVVKQGDPADSFYVLTTGRARALKIKPGGVEIPLGVLKPGDSFGEAALAEGGTRNATVRCSTAVDVLRIDRDDFLRLVRQVPDLKQYVETTGRNRALQSFLYQFSNFGRLPTSVLRGVIDKLKPVTFEKGNLIIREGDDAGPLYILQKGRARAFSGVDGAERNLAFYREGDFFGELSILNGSPRAASVEAFTGCELLSLEPQSVRELRRRFPEFDKLLGERLALYQAKTEARIPLDFTTELLPAETQVQNKVQLDGERPSAEAEDKEAPFADEEGLFRKRLKRIRKIDHIMQIDEMDCGAACLAMICRER